MAQFIYYSKKSASAIILSSKLLTLNQTAYPLLIFGDLSDRNLFPPLNYKSNLISINVFAKFILSIVRIRGVKFESSIYCR